MFFINIACYVPHNEIEKNECRVRVGDTVRATMIESEKIDSGNSKQLGDIQIGCNLLKYRAVSSFLIFFYVRRYFF